MHLREIQFCWPQLTSPHPPTNHGTHILPTVNVEVDDGRFCEWDAFENTFLMLPPSNISSFYVFKNFVQFFSYHLTLLAFLFGSLKMDNNFWFRPSLIYEDCWIALAGSKNFFVRKDFPPWSEQNGDVFFLVLLLPSKFSLLPQLGRPCSYSYNTFFFFIFENLSLNASKESIHTWDCWPDHGLGFYPGVHWSNPLHHPLLKDVSTWVPKKHTKHFIKYLVRFMLSINFSHHILKCCHSRYFECLPGYPRRHLLAFWFS